VIERAQLRGFARSIADVEWLLLFLVALYLFVADPPLARSPGVLAVLGGFTAFVVLFRFARPLKQHPHLKLAVEILVMLAFLTAVLAVSDGVRSPLVNLYLLPIVTAALALGRRAAALVVAVVCLCYPFVGVLTEGLSSLDAQFAIAAVGVLAPFVLVAFCTTLLVDNINTAKNRIRALSERDELTSLYNSRAFLQLAAQEHDAASRTGRAYSILLVDIEHLKAVNDAHGHEGGDRAVRHVAEALARLTRSTDIVARHGGDEFVVLLGGAAKNVAAEVAQRIRNVVFSTTLEVAVGRMVRIKVNVGAAAFPEDGSDLQAVVAVADRNLQKDKILREPPKGRLVIQKR
jgi:diguanylate cyclase (GGDEF)-like protein